MIKFLLLATAFILVQKHTTAQRLDSLYLNLYTDSLKRGTHNYINIDGLYSNGKVLPVPDAALRFQSSYGTFKGNCLILPQVVTVNKLSITVSAKDNPLLSKTVQLYIKQKPDDEILKTPDEILGKPKPKKSTPPSKTPTESKKKVEDQISKFVN